MSAPATPTPRPGRRIWRAAVVVFLTVFLGGLGVSGAAALWSHSGTVAATVTTGTWVDYTRPGFDMPLTVTATDYDPGIRRGVRLSYAHRAVDLPADARVTYQVTAREVHRLKVRKGLPYEGPSTTVHFETSIPTLLTGTEHVEITVTPIVTSPAGPVAGTPTVKYVSVDIRGNVAVGDPQ